MTIVVVKYEFVMTGVLPSSTTRNLDMASVDTVTLTESHPPKDRAIEEFNEVLPKIKQAIISSRREWDNHEPRMWARASGLSDDKLTNFVIETDLVAVRSGSTAYGTIVFGKLRIPEINDDEGEGFVHDTRSTEQGTEDVVFHSLLTEEGNRDADGRPTTFRAIQTLETPLEFFNE